MERLYRVEEMCTTGWELVDESSVRLTKDQARERLESLLNEGRSPNSIRAVPDSQ
jgi:hypothetical protein